MRIYVDELPKSCEECPCYYDEDGYEECKCNLTNNYVWYNKNGFFDCSQERPQDCPLQSLSEYTKQVRKEVCEEIKAEFDTSDFNKIGASLYPPTEEAMWIGKGFNGCKERLFNKLDQIQGE